MVLQSLCELLEDFETKFLVMHLDHDYDKLHSLVKGFFRETFDTSDYQEHLH